MSSIEEQRGPKKILVNLEKNNQYNPIWTTKRKQTGKKKKLTEARKPLELKQNLTFVSSESQKEKREGRVGKILEEMMVRISQIWQETNLHKDSKSWEDPKQDKAKETHVKKMPQINIKKLGTKTFWKQSERNNTLSTRKKKFFLNDCRFLIKNHGSQKEVALHFQAQIFLEL